jgi:hypothetical protein
MDEKPHTRSDRPNVDHVAPTWRRLPTTVGEGFPMTVQIPAARHDDLAIRLATRIELRLNGLADELEHADIVIYEADRGLATRGGVIRMTMADIAAVVAEVVLRGQPDDPRIGGSASAGGPDRL